MENIGYITALVLAVGTVFTAIYQAKGTTEKTLREHIERLEQRIKQLEDDDTKKDKVIEDLRTKYDDLLKLYQQEKQRNDRLEKRMKSRKRGGR